MTRKFRVWDGEKMHEPPHNYSLASNGLLWKMYKVDEKYCAQTVDNDTHSTLFYTGVTHEEDIYQHDIVSFHGYKAIVKWNDSIAGYALRVLNQDDSHIAKLGAVQQDLFVLGDRYRNPDLFVNEP